jgi:phosphoserine phosphatase
VASDPVRLQAGTVGVADRPVDGFSPEANAQLNDFFARTRTHVGRKVAVFDGDGTVVGQVPHYLADECLFAFAREHPDRKRDVIARMVTQSNVSLPYVQDRVHFFAGETVQDQRALGERCFRSWYRGKLFEPMRQLIARLHANGFEVWIITASPEALYQGFLARELGLPVTRVVGVKSVVRQGRLTDEIVPPVPQDEGKLAAIETFVQATPLLAGGNSRGDKEMIEASQGLRLIVNPDEIVAPDQTQSMADYARTQGWLVVRIRDVAEPGFPAVTSKEFGVRQNKAHPVP